MVGYIGLRDDSDRVRRFAAQLDSSRRGGGDHREDGFTVRVQGAAGPGAASVAEIASDAHCVLAFEGYLPDLPPRTRAADWLLAQQAKRGLDAFAELNGPYVFCLFDRRARRAWLGACRLCRRDLDYMAEQDGVLFASDPVAVAGELYLGGVQVARGYLGRPSLTAERFVPAHLGPVPGATLFKTGDGVTQLPDLNIEFLGRLDHQIKIRGFRVELGEIEAALTRHAAIHAATVVVREDVVGDQRLVAYVVLQEGAAASARSLRTALGEWLPDHMVPNHIVFLDALPLNTNGKIDRRALPPPPSGAAQAPGSPSAALDVS